MTKTAKITVAALLTIALISSLAIAAGGRGQGTRPQGPAAQFEDGQGPQQGPGQGFGQGPQHGRGGFQGRPGFGPQGPQMGPQGKPNPLMAFRHLVMELNLTDEQLDQVEAIFEENRQALQDSRQAVEEAQKALHEAAIEGADEAAIRTAAATLGEKFGDGAILMANLRKSVLAVLTQEQIAELEAKKEEAKAFQERMRQRMQRKAQQPGEETVENQDAGQPLPPPAAAEETPRPRQRRQR